MRKIIPARDDKAVEYKNYTVTIKIYKTLK